MKRSGQNEDENGIYVLVGRYHHIRYKGEYDGDMQKKNDRISYQSSQYTSEDQLIDNLLCINTLDVLADDYQYPRDGTPRQKGEVYELPRFCHIISMTILRGLVFHPPICKTSRSRYTAFCFQPSCVLVLFLQFLGHVEHTNTDSLSATVPTT